MNLCNAVGSSKDHVVVSSGTEPLDKSLTNLHLGYLLMYPIFPKSCQLFTLFWTSNIHIYLLMLLM